MDATRQSIPSAARITSRPLRLIAVLFLMLIAATSSRIGWSAWMPQSAAAAGVTEGQRLFDHETFGGNGRTCRTCHSDDDGTIDPGEVAKRLARNPLDPLFVHDGLDDFVSGTSRIAAHATILIERELPEGVVLLDDPFATSVVLARGVPGTVNSGEIARHRIALPMLDIHTIGAGGGSIGWLDEGGLLRVGPQSAGANPGPACYGLGGTLPPPCQRRPFAPPHRDRQR